MLMIQHKQHFTFTERPHTHSENTNEPRDSFPRGLINEYTYQNGIQFEIKSLQSLFFRSTCRYNVSTCRQELTCNYECDVNGVTISVIHVVQQTKRICLANNNIRNMMMILPVLLLADSLT